MSLPLADYEEFFYNNPMRKLPYITTIVAILALILLTLVYIALNSARLDTFLSTADSTAHTNAGAIVYDDPLITYVPEGDRSVDQKTKVFVSSQDPLLGNNQAQVYVVFYGNLLDATMQQYLAAVADLHDQLGDDVAFVWKDNVTNDAEKEAAMVSHCSDAVDRFWTVTAELENGTADGVVDVYQVATDNGVNESELDTCLALGGTGAQVDQSTALAGPLGVTNGHTVFVNDQLLTEPVTIEELKTKINETLATF